jgi:hypothetical protein
MQDEHLHRLHASATRLMIMSVIPERSGSADEAERKLQEQYNEIDYAQSAIYVKIMADYFKKEMKEQSKR